MFESFTDRARKVMALANQEAQRFRHPYIGTEHILLGLVKEGGGAGIKALENLGVDPRQIRAKVEKLLVPGSEEITTARLPRTIGANQVLRLAEKESNDLKYGYIGTEHLLFGLMLWGADNSDDIANQALMNLGLKLEEVRTEILRLLFSNSGPVDGGGVKEPVATEMKQLPPLSDLERVRLIAAHCPHLSRVRHSQLVDLCLVAAADETGLVRATRLRDLLMQALAAPNLAHLDHR